MARTALTPCAELIPDFIDKENEEVKTETKLVPCCFRNIVYSEVGLLVVIPGKVSNISRSLLMVG